jgi:DNA-binding NarL/FixJ family response regulator
VRQNYFKKLHVLAIETEEIYRHIYQHLPSEGSIELLPICEELDPEVIGVAIQSQCPDAIILGTGRVDGLFLSILADIKSRHPAIGLTILFNSCAGEELQKINELLKHSRSGTSVFLKQSLGSLSALIGIIHCTSLGQLNIDSTLINSLIYMKPESLFLKQLTEREREILDLLAKGFTNSGIAKALFLDNKTVENHINNMYTKLKSGEDFSNKHPRVTVARRYLQEVGNLHN